MMIYDDVNLETLCKTIDNFTIPPMITNRIVNFFNNRIVTLTTSGTLQKEVTDGIPHSPAIFHIYTSVDIHLINTNNVKTILQWCISQKDCYQDTKRSSLTDPKRNQVWGLVYIEDNNTQIQEKIKDNTTILISELKAIQRAIEKQDETQRDAN